MRPASHFEFETPALDVVIVAVVVVVDQMLPQNQGKVVGKVISASQCYLPLKIYLVFYIRNILQIETNDVQYVSH